jgi:Leucine-rich repeat (LRR) protein
MKKNLHKTNSTMETSYLISEDNLSVDDDWIQRLWDWADESGIGDLEWDESDRYWKGLPRDRKTLLNLTALTLSCKSLPKLPKEIGELKTLTRLDLSHSNLTELPKEVGRLSNLTELDLSWNGLTELPEGILKLTNLSKLNLSFNSLIKLPEAIGKLSNLAELKLFSNKLREVPKEIGNLAKLTSLDLSLNRLTALPEEMDELSSLTKFSLSVADALDSLPENKQEKRKAILSKMKTFMNNAGHRNKVLVDNFSKVDDRQLQKLWDWADENNISSEDLPRDRNELLWLEDLNLGADDIECDYLNEIPEELGILTNLTSLSFCVDGDKCKELPESIGRLTNLTELLINVCAGEVSMPKSISNLTELTLISLAGNIPTSSIALLLENCESLERLFIENNQILKILPKNICHCDSIWELVLIHNKNLLLTPKQFKWANELRDEEEGWDRIYCTELPDGTSLSYTTDYGQKFRYYCYIPFDSSEEIPKPDFPSEEELFEVETSLNYKAITYVK